MIKVVAFDNDCVISQKDMLEFVSEQIGKTSQGKFWEKEYHKGLAKAKNDKEREKAALKCLKGKYSVIKGLDLKTLKKICQKIEATKGAKQCIDALQKRKIEVVVVSATLLPIAKFFAQTHGLKISKFITSECKTNGKIGKTTFVLTPLKKGKKLSEYLIKNGIRTNECVAVGDSKSECSMFKLAGKKRSIGFNCRKELKPFVGHIASHFGDKKRDLMCVLKIMNDL